MEASALIKQARRAAGLTQAELAKRAGVKQPEIARLEAAGANPRIATLNRVVAATGNSLSIELGPPSGLDESLIVGSLGLTPAERLRAFESFYRSAQGMGGRAFVERGS